MAQRIVRAKRKIVDAQHPVPRAGRRASWPARLDAVLAVLYLMFNEGYLSRGAQLAMRRDLAEDALWLTRPGRHADARPARGARAAGADEAEPRAVGRALRRGRRDGPAARPGPQRCGIRRAIADGDRACSSARARCRRPGPYQLQAAIAAVHAEARSWEDTDWHQIVVLYDALLRMADSPVVRLNRAVALSHFAGPEVALGEVNDLAHDARATTTCSIRRAPSCSTGSASRRSRARRGCARSSCARTPPSGRCWNESCAR